MMALTSPGVSIIGLAETGSIYLDANATTRPLSTVVDLVASVMRDHYANPLSARSAQLPQIACAIWRCARSLLRAATKVLCVRWAKIGWRESSTLSISLNSDVQSRESWMSSSFVQLKLQLSFTEDQFRRDIMVGNLDLTSQQLSTDHAAAGHYTEEAINAVPAVTFPYSAADHIQHGDPVHTARELVVHLGQAEAVTRAIHYKTQVTMQDAPVARFWSQVYVAIGQIKLPESRDPLEMPRGPGDWLSIQIIYRSGAAEKNGILAWHRHRVPSCDRRSRPSRFLLPHCANPFFGLARTLDRIYPVSTAATISVNSR